MPTANLANSLINLFLPGITNTPLPHLDAERLQAFITHPDTRSAKQQFTGLTNK
jgi:hypothetical protein